MLSEIEIQKLSADLKIDRERILREFYELLLLNGLSQQSWSHDLIFKGGTALRLAHQSPRFSDDLDFAVISVPATEAFFHWTTQFARQNGVAVTDQQNKYATLLVDFNIDTSLLSQPFHLKIEISKRSYRHGKAVLKILTSPVSPLQVLFKVATTESILQDKLEAWRDRRAPRDLFDIWYIAQKIDQSFPKLLDKQLQPPENRKHWRNELRKYLPYNWHQAIDEMEKYFQ